MQTSVIKFVEAVSRMIGWPQAGFCLINNNRKQTEAGSTARLIGVHDSTCLMHYVHCVHSFMSTEDLLPWSIFVISSHLISSTKVQHTPLCIRFLSWQWISEQILNQEEEGTACRAQRPRSCRDSDLGKATKALVLCWRLPNAQWPPFLHVWNVDQTQAWCTNVLYTQKCQPSCTTHCIKRTWEFSIHTSSLAYTCFYCFQSFEDA